VRLVDARKIWDQAPHNAFTDLIRYRGRWYCAFREGQGHVSADGALRILTSRDGNTWESAALLRAPNADLRDPKLAVTPDGRLMVTTAGALHQPAAAHHQSMAWFSRDARTWTEPVPIGDPDQWLWRVTWNRGAAYSASYSTVPPAFLRLYTSQDGRTFTTLVDKLFEAGRPTEASLLFLKDGTALCLLRRDEKGNDTAQLGASRPPYRDWSWKDLGVRFGGPQLIASAKGDILAAGRLYDGRVRTALCRLDRNAGTLAEILTLPSSGDTSYPGLVWHQNLLWISYYSSHEGKTSIYLARVKLD
jgi:hypothetical protein